MKLKKIASLALAGVMAVSMLAGCAGKTGTTDNTDTEVSTSASDIVKAVNDGQSAGNDVKVTFTADSDLDTALQRAVAEKGKTATSGSDIEAIITNLTGIKSVKASSTFSSTTVNGAFLTDAPTYDAINKKNNNEKIDGVTYTYFEVMKLTGFASEAAVESYVATEVDEKVATLDKTSDISTAKGGEKYYSYSYDGNVSMASVKNADGTTVYYVAVVGNQHIAEKTL